MSQTPGPSNPYQAPVAATEPPPPEPVAVGLSASPSGLVIAAAVLWIIIGGLASLSHLIVLFRGGIAALFAVVALAFDLVFIFGAISLLRGRSEDVMGMVVFSFVMLGLLFLMVLSCVVPDAGPAALLVLIVPMIALGLPPCLALGGRRRYQAWIAWRHGELPPDLEQR